MKNIDCDIAITMKCNGGCKCCSYLCDINNPDSSTMTIEDVENAMKEVDNYNSLNGEFHIKTMRILGGEPTLHKDLFKIIEIIQNHKIGIKVFSNTTANHEIYAKLRDVVLFTGTIKDKHEQHIMFPANYQKFGYKISNENMINYPCCGAFCIRKIEGTLKYFYCPCQSSIAIALDRIEETSSDTIQEALDINKRKNMIKDMCPMCWWAYKNQSLPKNKYYNMLKHCPQIINGIEKYKKIK